MTDRALPFRRQLRAFRAAGLAVLCGLALSACDDAPDPSDAEAALEESEQDRAGALELTIADQGHVEGVLEVDGETITVAVETNGTTRELVVRGRDEYARWAFDAENELTVGHIDGHTFGNFEDRFHSLDQAYWDEMRGSRAGVVLPVVSEAAWQRYAAGELDDASSAALHDLTRLQAYVETLGTIPPEWQAELQEQGELPESEEMVDVGYAEAAIAESDFDLSADPNPTAACASNTSAAAHSITSVQVFQTGCRINHTSFTRKPSGGCDRTRCVRHYHSNGASASSAFCNNPSQTLNQAHVVPRNGGTYGLWSHHWAAGTPLDLWYYRSAPCPR